MRRKKGGEIKLGTTESELMEYNPLIEEILDNVKEYQDENYDNPVDDVNQLSFTQLLREYLYWNGIFGYTDYIIALIKYCLPVKDEDLLK